MNYYVDVNDGLDTQAGSLAAPFKSLQHAIAVMHVGDSVTLIGGDYDVAGGAGGTGPAGPAGPTGPAGADGGAGGGDFLVGQVFS